MSIERWTLRAPVETSRPTALTSWPTPLMVLHALKPHIRAAPTRSRTILLIARLTLPVARKLSSAVRSLPPWIRAWPGRCRLRRLWR